MKGFKTNINIKSQKTGQLEKHEDSTGIFRARRVKKDTFQVLKDHNCQPDYYTQQNYILKLKEK